jgi:putative transposase
LVAYRRNYIHGATRFFTVNLRNRKSALLTQQVAALRHAIMTVKRQKPFYIDAWVVLPEHLHCIWTLPDNDCDFSGRWRDIKGGFSRTLSQNNVWQPRFWEHTIRNQQDHRRHVDYIYMNPFKHGWVKQIQDWPFSTFQRDVRRGLYPANWSGEVDDFTCAER